MNTNSEAGGDGLVSRLYPAARQVYRPQKGLTGLEFNLLWAMVDENDFTVS